MGDRELPQPSMAAIISALDATAPRLQRVIAKLALDAAPAIREWQPGW